MQGIGFRKRLAPLVAPVVAPVMARWRGQPADTADTDKAKGAAKVDASAVDRVPLKKRLHQSSAWMSHAVVLGLAVQGVWLTVHAAPDRTTAELVNLSGNVDDATDLRSGRLTASAAVPDTPPVHVVTARVVPTLKAEADSDVTPAAADDAPSVIEENVVTTETKAEDAPTRIAAEARDRSPRVPPVRRVAPRRTPIVEDPADTAAANAFPVEHLPLPKHLTRDVSAETPDVGDDATSKAAKSNHAKPGLADRSLVAVARDTIGFSRKQQAYMVVPSWAPDQVAEERRRCDALLKSRNIAYSAVPPIKQGSCGAPAPVQVSRFGASKVDVHPAATMTCAMVAAIDDWLKDEVQPAANTSFGAPVVRLVSASSYSCRNRYGRKDTKISEHALVNALDLSGFRLADGRIVRVLDGWGPTERDPKPEPKKEEPGGKTAKVAVAIAVMPPATLTRAGLPKTGLSKNGLSKLGASDIAKSRAAEAEKDNEVSVAAKSEAAAPVKDAKTLKRERAERERRERAMAQASFLRNVHRGACDHFGTVLGPEANDAHRDHFHFDMKLRRHRAYCQ